MTDLKYLSSNFSRTSKRLEIFGRIVITTALIVLVIALCGWCIRLLPGAIDQAFGLSATDSQQVASGEIYHPTTHVWTFYGVDQ